MVEEMVKSDKWIAAECEAASGIAAGLKTDLLQSDRKVETIETESPQTRGNARIRNAPILQRSRYTDIIDNSQWQKLGPELI